MKIILILLSLSLMLQASYTKMLKLYQAGHYSQTIKEAKHSLEEYSNPQLHLLWAKSAQKLGNEKDAMGAYERVLILDENNEEAFTALNTLYENSNRQNLSANADNEDNNKMKVRANIALGYDSNVNVNPGSAALDDFFGTVGSQGKIGSKFLRFSANMTYTYYFENYPGWFAKGVLDFYNQSNFSAHRYDLRVATTEVGLGYESDRYRLYLPLRYNSVHYLDKNLLEHYEFLPHITLPVFDATFLDVNALYIQRAYLDSIDNVNDADTWGLGTGLYFPLYGSRASVHLQYEKRTSSQSTHNKFLDANFFRIDASIQHYFTPELYIELTYLYRYGDYSDDIGTLLVPDSTLRKDDFNQIDVELTYNISKKYALYARDTYSNNRSTYTPSRYTKNIIMFGIKLNY